MLGVLLLFVHLAERGRKGCLAGVAGHLSGSSQAEQICLVLYGHDTLFFAVGGDVLVATFIGDVLEGTGELCAEEVGADNADDFVFLF